MKKSFVVSTVVFTVFLMFGIPAHAQDSGFNPAYLSVGGGLGFEGAWGDNTDNIDPSGAFMLYADYEVVPNLVAVGASLGYGWLGLDSPDMTYSRFIFDVTGKYFVPLSYVGLRAYGLGSIGWHKDTYEYNGQWGSDSSSDSGLSFGIGGGVEYQVIPDVLSVGGRIRAALFTWDDSDSDFNHWDLMLTATYHLVPAK